MEGLASRLILGTGLSSPSPYPNATFLPLKTHHHIQHLQRSSLTTSITIKAHQHFTPIRSFHIHFNKTCFGFSRFRSNWQASKEEEEQKQQQEGKIGKAGLFVTWVVLIMVGLQGRFCRPALAAWYWPFGTSKTTQQEIVDLATTYSEEGTFSRRKLRKLIKEEDKFIAQEKKKALKEWEESVEQEYEEELGKADPQVVESRAKEITSMLRETFPELESAAEDIESVMKEILPHLRSVDHKKLVHNMPKLWVYLTVRSGNFDRAVRILDRLIENEPYRVQWLQIKEHVLHHAGRRELEADRPEEARMYLEELLEMEPFNPRALQVLAMAMHKLGEDAAMIQTLKERVQQAKKIRSSKDVYNMKLLLANAYTVQGNLEEALKQYRRLTDENPKDYKSYLAQGIIYSVLDRKDEAEERFEKYREVVPDGVPREDFLDKVMMEALAEGHKFFEEKNKDAVAAQEKEPIPETKKSTINTEPEDEN